MGEPPWRAGGEYGGEKGVGDKKGYKIKYTGTLKYELH